MSLNRNRFGLVSFPNSDGYGSFPSRGLEERNVVKPFDSGQLTFILLGRRIRISVSMDQFPFTAFIAKYFGGAKLHLHGRPV